MTQENRWRDNNTLPSLISKLKENIVEREQEIEAIKMQFDVVLEGQTALSVIAGDVGCGKTTLIKTVLADLSKLNGTCVYGKFEQFKNEEPYVAIIQIVEQITDQILTFPDEKLNRIKNKLVKELGKDATLITDIIPKAQKIMGETGRANTDDYQKLKVRLEKAFRAFISITAREMFPLIMAIDDLQWADKPSWNIISSIADQMYGIGLYIILSYRNNLEKYRIKVNSMLDTLGKIKKNMLEITVGSLSPGVVKRLLDNAFGGDFDNIDKLLGLVYRKTTGNPLYVQILINLLHKNEGIYFDPQNKVWHLNLDIARETNLPNSIVGIINSKIESLNHDQKRLLEIASCIGSRFSIGLLSRIMNENLQVLEEKLKEICRTGLIVETIEDSYDPDNTEFEFFHDRIYQNVYEHIEPERKEWLHFIIAMELLNSPDRSYIEDNILPITSHLLKCKRIIKTEITAERLVDYLYLAGIKAKCSAAVEHALKLFGLGEELLGPSCWQEDYDNAFRIKIELAECEFICGQYDKAMDYYKELLEHADGQETLAEIKKRQMIMYSYTGDHDKVIEHGFPGKRRCQQGWH
ncbi:MAG: AAA family ATPase [Clostridiaceae bacterium]|nr:AAA family ATPase [Clostridiaceae bacterium]